MSLSTQQISIVSTYQGALWAGKILTDWGCNVRYGVPTQKTAIIIGDETNLLLMQKFFASRIILTDVQMGAPHILALSGTLVTFGQKSDYFAPNHLVQTVVSNSLAIKILQNAYDILEKKISNKTVEYISIVSLVKYLGAFNISAKYNDMISFPRGQNLLDGGAPFYSVYPCKNGFIAVGNLQPKFYQQMIKGFQFPEELNEFCQDSQFSMSDWPKLKQILTKKFAEKSSIQWQYHFQSYDTCITSIRQPTNDKTREPKLLPKL